MILDGVFPPDPRVENEAISLIEDGHDVHLFCLSYQKKHLKKETINGIKIHRFYCNKLTYKLSALAYTLPFYHLAMLSIIKKFIIDNQIETIHIHDIQISRAVFWGNKKWNKKIVLDLHENRPEIMKFYAHVNTFFGKLLIHPKIWKKQEFKSIKKANEVIVVTNAAKTYYHSKTNKPLKNIHVVPNTIREAFYTNHTINENIVNTYKNQFTVLYLGDTGIRRGTLDLIASISLLIDTIPNIKLVIVGKSKDDQHLLQKVKELKLENHVDLAGWQDVNLFQSYILGAKIGVSPLHRNLHHDTTFANKVFQYLSFGLPVIASDATAQKEVLEQNKCGLIHPEKSPQAIADRILELYNDSNLYTTLSNNALQTIKNRFHWEETVLELLDVYSY